ncbi:uncharacterized protein LOC132953307, partial [Metopolophium dirhodum]|uniref:uncharacterized protein LOC132953307 n=1 Tax=Metopolophium dirhodum TaxID=44670 RepID=UPI002990006E
MIQPETEWTKQKLFNNEEEPVNSVRQLSTELFHTALRIFIERRGCPLHIHSDNERNFVGASAQHKNFFGSREFKQNINAYTIQAGIDRSFIPPHSPHVGGLWRAGVKPMKFHHLRRSLGESILKDREAKTLLSQMETVLNSRTLTPASTHDGDKKALTPGHLIIGKPLTALPETNYLDIKAPSLRWHMVQQLIQGFWKRWRTEYLQSLQVRHKWTQTEANLKVASIKNNEQTASDTNTFIMVSILKKETASSHKITE